jgi:hypothetical protein
MGSERAGRWIAVRNLARWIVAVLQLTVAVLDGSHNQRNRSDTKMRRRIFRIRVYN